MTPEQKAQKRKTKRRWIFILAVGAGFVVGFFAVFMTLFLYRVIPHGGF